MLETRKSSVPFSEIIFKTCLEIDVSYIIGAVLS